MKEREAVRFCGATDIWNLQTLRDAMKGMPVEKLKQIAEYLDVEVGTLTTKVQEEKRRKEEEKKKTEEPGDNNEVVRTLWQICCLFLLLLWAILFVQNRPNYTIKRKVPEDIAKFEMVINGDTIKLPATLKQMESYGWVCADESILENLWIHPHDVTASYGTLEESFLFDSGVALTNGYGEITVYLQNPSNCALEAEGCVISRIEISHDTFNYTGQNYNTLELPLGLDLGESKCYRLFLTGGYSKYDLADSTIYYYYGDDWTDEYSFYFDKPSEKLTSVSMSCNDEDVMLEVMDIDQYFHSVRYDPDAVAERIGAEMSVDIGDRTIPVFATVSQYLDCGFYLASSSDDLDEPWLNSVRLKDDTSFEFEVSVYNPLGWEIREESCFVYSIDTADFSRYDGDFVLNINRVNRISQIYKGMTAEELYAVIEELGLGIYDIAEYPFGIQFYLSGDVSVDCTLSPEDRKVENIRVHIEGLADEYVDKYCYLGAVG